MSNDLTLILNTESTDNRSVKIRLTLKSSADSDLYINSDAILSDGFTSNKFTITGPSVIECHIPSVKYEPGTLKLHSGGSISNVLMLSDVCNFEDATEGKYNIEFKTYVHPCLDADEDNCSHSIELSGQTEINLN